ncbi:UNVERIFIED_CONTAM: hypothetical protein PYX00_008223 [Menopon gallinae]|uniref:PilZ domain-containing protein n=1 Tax=Menopon gallinae TaxID=328185 RepID=A0AAW2HLX4_9NEOP
MMTPLPMMRDRKSIGRTSKRLNVYAGDVINLSGAGIRSDAFADWLTVPFTLPVGVVAGFDVSRGHFVVV